ncbi:hypothetical protein [Kitasatospora sp. GAS204B]|uniref:hypothetical protein n=1 Tax=unclassified Kitasatospora TaxID=2633591 RepID=UPI002476C69D|nr:hypothetical protein [Kitasatospora sp. GAS204B]MDH6115940.1 hypothetical protein [Kitasatospora sp. GAS204B]
MSYAPPVGGFPTPQRAPAGPRAAALPGLAVLLILILLLDLAILGFDLNRDGVNYLPTALGINYDHYIQGVPVYYVGGNTAFDLGLIAMIIGAFSGGGWVRPAGSAVLLVAVYSDVMSVVAQLTGNSESRHEFSSPGSNLLLNLDVIGQAVLGVLFAVIVAATVKSKSAPALPGPGAPAGFAPQFAPPPGPGRAPAAPGFGGPPAQGYGAPIPPQPTPGYPAPAAPAMQPPAPAQPPAMPPAPPATPPAYGYPPRPQDGPPAP